MKKLVFWSFVVTVIGHCAGKYFGFYEQLWEYDSLMHFIGGVFAGTLGIYVVHITGKGNHYFSAINFAFVLGFLWELQQEFVQLCNYPLSDTMLDIIMDLVGGAFAGFVFFVLRRRMKKEEPL